MTSYDYLIIGGGMTAAAAVDGIREVDPTAQPGPFTQRNSRGFTVAEQKHSSRYH
jgi:hypothetical protein